ncbi:hypothetical protein KP509_04G023000 [Ceratopteris richardii]|uniref:PRA1 family protein n=1 Tax=Ceratopteris richardii TaxID=49495 RepID=A0A8T2UYQ4_CERRI|nr:hypothetical protein KP509_04G023000 [Ceratopteris richardii]
MDWGNVTVIDLVEALQEVDWTTPPRPLSEFFAKFSVPSSVAKLESRSKCNFYYYRTNYFILLAVILVVAFLRNPLALFAVAMAAFCIACFNDSFALSVSHKITKSVRRISPQLAAKMRPPMMPVIRGRPTAKRAVYICGQSRNVVVLVMAAVTLLLWFLTSAFLTVFGALSIALAGIILHSSLRTPNLKARLNTFREEFRAVWRTHGEF